MEKEDLEVIFVYESFRFASYLNDSRGEGLGIFTDGIEDQEPWREQRTVL